MKTNSCPWIHSIYIYIYIYIYITLYLKICISSENVSAQIRCYRFFNFFYIYGLYIYCFSYGLSDYSYGPTVHYSGTILWNSLPPNLKLIQDIDLFKKKYTYYLMSKQKNEWLYSLYQGFILDYTQIMIFRCEYVCIVWNCICCIWLLLFWGPQGRLAYCC